MAKLYGTVTNEQSKTSTRAAHRIVTASAQSWVGSVAVTQYEDGRVTIAVGKGSESDPSRVLVFTTIQELLDAQALELK